MRRSLTVGVGGLARRALAGERGADAEQLAARAEPAIRTYLGDREAARPGWQVPAFAGRQPAERFDLPLNLDEDLWSEVEAESAAQGVSVDQLIAHAILYCAAEIDAGRTTQRIAEGLDDEDE